MLIRSIHANINQCRWIPILQAIDKDFGSYALAEANTSQGKLLFGQDFTEALQEKVKAKSPLSRRLLDYCNRPGDKQYHSPLRMIETCAP